MELRKDVLHSAPAFGNKHHSSCVLVMVLKTEQVAIHCIISDPSLHHPTLVIALNGTCGLLICN